MIYVGGYYEYIEGCSVHWRNTMSISGGKGGGGNVMIHVGEQIDKSL